LDETELETYLGITKELVCEGSGVTRCSACS